MTDTGIECFLALCRHKTVSRAAEALFITQPSLSTRLKTLEQELGGELFYRQRGRREMTLTPAGKAFYELALQYEEITQKMLQVCRVQRQALRVSSLNSLGNYLLPQVYDRFMQAYPEVELQIQDMELEGASRSLLAGTTDISFISGKTGDEHLVQKPVLREPMAVICSQQSGLNHFPELHELKRHQELYIEWSNYFATWHRKTVGVNHSQLTVSIMAHLRQFMETKDCWAIVPISVAQGLKKECPSIRILDSSFTLPYRDISLLTTADKEASDLVTAFLQCLKELLAEHPEINSLL